MRIYHRTKISENYIEAMKGFDISLFQKLVPFFLPIKIKKFTGSKKGDQVHLSIFNSDWISDIISDHQDENQATFVDVGSKLPFPLKSWKHEHIVEKITQNESYIIDEIEFKTMNMITDILVYPLLWFSFFMRKHQYKKYFNY